MFALTFDEDFAKSTGINVEFYNIIIAILCSLTIVLGMRMMGGTSYFKFNNFPMSYIHVFLQGFQACSNFFCHPFFYLFYCRIIYFIPLCSPNWSVYCNCEFSCIMHYTAYSLCHYKIIIKSFHRLTILI